MKPPVAVQTEIRNKMIFLASKEGLSLQEIVDIFKRPLGKSRIGQILKEINRKEFKNGN